MSSASNIEWTQATWNPVSGCTRVHAGCDHCYAVTMTHRLASMGKSKYAGLTVLNPRGDRHFNGVVKCHEDALTVPLRWRKPRRVFVNSMSDLFHEKVPDRFIRLVFAAMSYAGQHTFQVLTKRPARAAAFFADPENDLSACQAEWVVAGIDDTTPTGKHRVGRRGSTGSINGTRRGVGDGNYWPLPNVWIGTSVSDQPTADAMVPHLLRCPGVRFVSYEPALGPVDFSAFFGGPYVGLPGDKIIPNYNLGIDWIIVGGESGTGARPFDAEWARSVIAQGKAAGVPVFVKQLGGRPCDTRGDVPEEFGDVALRLRSKKGGDMSEWPDDLRVREFPTGCEVGNG